MLTRFLTPGVAVANYAESGETLKSFVTSLRMDKMLSQMKRGDYLLIQFGHNDMKENWPQTYADAATTYKEYLRVFITEARRRGVQPVLVTSMHRRNFEGARIKNTLGEYPQAVRDVAKEAGVPLIDLNTMSAKFYEALGPEKSSTAFAPRDGTHHSAYGAYELGEVRGIKTRSREVYRSVSEDVRPVASRSAGVARVHGQLAAAAASETSRDAVADRRFHRPQRRWANGSNGQWGWGDEPAPFFDAAKMVVVNKALGADAAAVPTSAKDTGTTMLPRIQPGDVVMMQFGHNDGSLPDEPSRARGSLKGTGDESRDIENPITKRHETVYTYGWYLRKYGTDTRARGATPIVCSPVPRLNFKDGHVTRGEVGYAGWAAEVARAANVPFVDLNNIIADKYDSLGEATVTPLFILDHTHTSLSGAELNVACVVKGIKALKDSPLSGTFLEKPNACEVQR